MQQYHDMLRHILTVGVQKGDRTGTGTISTFGHQLRFDLKEGFPLVTTKKVHLKSIIHELLWFLSGNTNAQYLQDNGVGIWDEWAAPEDVYEEERLSVSERVALYAQETGETVRNVEHLYRESPDGLTSKMAARGIPTTRRVLIKKKGDLGRVYGAQWRDWIGPNGEHIDQITKVIDRLKTDPDCRRLIVTAWQPAEIEKMALPPCHLYFQFWTRELSKGERIDWINANLPAEAERVKNTLMAEVEADKFVNNDAGLIQRNYELYDEVDAPRRAISCNFVMRSTDSFLGAPFNIASYALLTMMIAQVVNMVPEELVFTGNDVHIYTNHLEQVGLQLSREPRALPRMKINPNVKDIFGFKYEDFELVGYDPHPAIKAPVAV